MLLLENTIQNYAWGSRTELAQILGRPPPQVPEAELWIGAHPRAPSRLSDGRSLLEAIETDPAGMLGVAVCDRFGPRLPFLLKILAVDSPLSLQAHPNLEQARAGFAREQNARVPLDAPERVYKDDNHKPELLCALGPFEALSGFRAPAEVMRLFEALGLAAEPFLAPLRGGGNEPLRGAFMTLMTLGPEQKARLLAAVLAGCERARALGTPFSAALDWTLSLAQQYPGDIGAVAALLLNHLRLEPLQAIYLEAGRLHAYLRGTGVEIMANSDNVLRGGLTPKFVNVPELLSVLSFDSPPMRPAPIRQEGPGVRIYETPATEFQLACIDLPSDAPFVASVEGPELLLCIDGQVFVEERTFTDDASDIPETLPPRPLRKGQACFLPASSESYRLRGAGRVFRATVRSLPQAEEPA